MSAPARAVCSRAGDAIAEALLTWYRDARRDLPWRKTRHPYAIWVSEVMLQQTQVTTVIPYYQRWMRRFPTLAALARASEADVLRVWEGLGYYSRARRLHRGAQAALAEHGRVPHDPEALLALPGIGRYTAGAIASIAFGRRMPVLDGNVVRVLTRLFALRGDPARAPLHDRLWSIAEELVPAHAPGDFNQALMELGATTCTPRAPRCDACPLRRKCAAHRRGIEDELPELARRPKVTQVSAGAAIVFRRGHVLVVRLGEDAPRWAGMWAFPAAEAHDGELSERAAARAVREQCALEVAPETLVGVVRHGVTRFRITLDAWRCELQHGRARATACAEVAWRRPSELASLAMPKAHRQIAGRLASSLHGAGRGVSCGHA